MNLPSRNTDKRRWKQKNADSLNKNMEDLLQRAADATRIVKAGLRTHDPEVVGAGEERE
jgi:hypothetical protein